MTCKLVEKVSALIDGELSQSEARALERHAMECSDCRQARADFLNLRNQIVSYHAASSPVSREALAKILAKDRRQPVASDTRAGRSPGLFAGLRFTPALASVAFLLVAAVVGLLFYRNAWQREKRTGDLTVQQPLIKTQPKVEQPQSGSNPLSNETRVEGSVKPANSKPRKQKTRPPVDIPKPRTVPDDLISPWRSQAIAVNTAPNDGMNAGIADTTNAGGVRSADAETLTAQHLEQSELLLRSFRNVRTPAAGARSDVAYERKRAQRLVYQNIILRREADSSGDVQVATLLDSLEPILLDIANLPDNAHDEDVRAIKERVQKKNLVALLQVNSIALARANE